MTSRERVIATIKGEKRDRMPLFGWLGNAEFSPKVEDAFGSIETFQDKYEFDLAAGSCPTWPFDWEQFKGGDAYEEPHQMFETVPMTNPDDADFSGLIADLKHHKDDRGRFYYVWLPGFFEYCNSLFGMENNLMYLLLYPEQIKETFDRVHNWYKKMFVNLKEIGVDMVLLSDDWGSQRSLMFSKEVLNELIIPVHKATVEDAHKVGLFASLHCDGDINDALDGIVECGYDVLHPYQESAGMSVDKFKSQYMDKFTVMGGIDVQTTLGFGKYDFLESEIRRIVGEFKDKGMILSTSHSIQPHCEIEEAKFAYDLMYKLIRE